MRRLAYGVVVLVLAGCLGAVDADEQAASQSPEQQSAPQEPTTAEQQAAPQPKVSPEQQAAADKLGLAAAITNSIGMKLVLIPAGEFMMGSPATEEGREIDEQQHRVRITKSFYLGVHEVTQEQYEGVMGVKPSRIEQPQYPVDTVSWDSAVEFCEKLLALPDEKAAGRAYRLPTEAEWEYACRAGSATRYSFGDAPAGLVDYGWFEENSSKTTHPVGEKRPNAWGLYDMHGNVCEWCADWYDRDYYRNSPADDPAGPSTGSDRVTRGGSWFIPAKICRLADHDGRPPIVRNFGLGFRVALDVGEKVEPPKEANRFHPRIWRMS